MEHDVGMMLYNDDVFRQYLSKYYPEYDNVVTKSTSDDVFDH